MMVKHSVSSPPTKCWGTFFVKKLCMGENFFFFLGGGGANLGEMFYMGTNNQIMQGGS